MADMSLSAVGEGVEPGMRSTDRAGEAGQQSLSCAESLAASQRSPPGQTRLHDSPWAACTRILEVSPRRSDGHWCLPVEDAVRRPHFLQPAAWRSEA